MSPPTSELTITTSRLGVRGAERPLPFTAASKAIAGCALRTGILLGRRQLHQPTGLLRRTFRFADATAASVYRETSIDRSEPTAPALLVISFRLRWVRSERGHALFRGESVLNTVLFSGFPGLVSKLWFRHDEHGTYRGLYEWDDPRLAISYARALWWVLACVSVRGSIRYAVLSGIRRADLLRDPTLDGAMPSPEGSGWWQVVEVEPSRTRAR